MGRDPLIPAGRCLRTALGVRNIPGNVSGRNGFKMPIEPDNLY